MEYNGSAIMAMKGKNCVAIAADRRFGVQALTMGTDFTKIFKINDRTYVGLPGLATDVQTLAEQFRMKTNLYKLDEERDITPTTFAHLVSSTLYERRFLIITKIRPIFRRADRRGCREGRLHIHMLHGPDWMHQLCKRLCGQRNRIVADVRHVRKFMGA